MGLNAPLRAASCCYEPPVAQTRVFLRICAFILVPKLLPQTGRKRRSALQRCRALLTPPSQAWHRPAAKASGSFTEIGKDLTIEIDSRLLQPMNQVAIGNAIQLGSGADAHNPQTAKVALANATVTHGVLQRLLNGFFCGPMQFALGTSESRGKFQNLFGDPAGLFLSLL
jgi:hypothetical protein